MSLVLCAVGVLLIARPETGVLTIGRLLGATLAVFGAAAGSFPVFTGLFYGLIPYFLHRAFHSLLTAKPLVITSLRLMPFFISASQ